MKKIEELKLDFLPIMTIEEQIWETFDILKDESIGSEEYHIILFLLSLYKDGIISSDSLSNLTNFNQSLISRINVSDQLNVQQYLGIYQSFEPTLNRLSSDGLKDLIQGLSNIDKEVLSKNFSFIFDKFLYRITDSQGRYGGEFIQPVALTRFICKLADLSSESSVFNPFAGLASFGVFLEHGSNYFGHEINRKTWALGALRLMAYKRPGTSRYMCEDSIENWPPLSEKFDLILANPPYNTRLSERYRPVGAGVQTIEQFLIKKGVNSLTNKGKLIALLPQGFLFRHTSREQELREFLINEDLLDSIISLPGGVLPNTGIPSVILVINKKKEKPGKVRMIKADNFVSEEGPREKILNDYALNSFIYSNREDADVLKIVDISKIKELNYNLNVHRYFQKTIVAEKNEQLVKLKDMLEYVTGRRGKLVKSGKLVRVRDLKDDKVDFKLDLSMVEEKELGRPSLRQLDESCLLITTRWRTLKPTLFEFSATPIFLNSEILSFKVNSAIVDTYYLINELHADYVEEQLSSYRNGVTMPIIRINDLLEVVIKLPSLEEQRAKVQGIIELSGDIKALKQQRDALVYGTATRQFNEFASLKHTLGRPRQNILDWTDNLLHFLSVLPEGFDALNNSFKEFYDTDILSALKEIKHDVNFMTDVLENGENGFVMERFDKTIISLSDINSIISGLSNNGFNFKIKKFLLDSEKLKERGIYGNKTLLKTLIDNLLTNANKYGFEKRAAGNEVIFELAEVNDFLSMEVRNNGKPFPKNFDREKFIVKYSTADSKSGSGLGGYDIHRIASEFQNPNWILTLNEDSIYPAIFKFHFPMKPIN